MGCRNNATHPYLHDGWGYGLSFIELILYIHTFVSLILNLLCIMFKIIAFFRTLFARLYVRIGILFTCGKHLHDCIISLRWDAWVNKMTSNLTLATLYWSAWPSQENEWSYICVSGVSILHLSPQFNCWLDFGTVPKMCMVFVYVIHFYHFQIKFRVEIRKPKQNLSKFIWDIYVCLFDGV